MRENPKFCRHFVQINVPAINSNAKSNPKHVQAGGACIGNIQVSAKRVCQTTDIENIKCQAVTVALFVPKFMWSARRACQSDPSPDPSSQRSAVRPNACRCFASNVSPFMSCVSGTEWVFSVDSFAALRTVCGNASISISISWALVRCHSR